MSTASRSIPAEHLGALLRGESPPDELARYDELDLTSSDSPDLRFADADQLAPLFRHPALRRVRRLRMAEGAGDSDTLPQLLSWLEPGCLEAVQFRSTEAYSSATDGETLAALVASPAAQNLRELALDYTNVSGVDALTGSSLRSLERVRFIGSLGAEEYRALAKPAPALRSLKQLVLTVDSLEPALARRIAASPDLAALEVLELPFVQGGGFDWSGEYDEPEFAARFPGVLAALQAMPGLKVIRLTTPYYPLDSGVSLAAQLATLEALTGGCPVELADGLFAPELLEVARARGVYELVWDLDDSVTPPPPAVWVERLHQSGASAALGALGPPPSTLDRQELDDLAAALTGRGELTLEEVDVDGLLERWGARALEAMLRARGVAEDARASIRVLELEEDLDE